MPTATLSRSDAFPVGTSVGIYPFTARRYGQPPTAAVIASGTVDAAGALSVTNAGILQGADYVAYAAVNGEHRYVTVRSTLDVTATGRATGTATTTSGSAALTSVSASTGAFAIGQRVAGTGIPGGTFLIAGSGGSWTMSGPASASAAGVAIEGHGANPAVTGGTGQIGQSLVPVTVSTRWQAKVRQRRAAIGTS